MNAKDKDKQATEREFETIRNLSRRTGKCYRTIHRAVRTGKIRAVQMGGSVMIPRSEVERVLAHGWR